MLPGAVLPSSVIPTLLKLVLRLVLMLAAPSELGALVRMIDEDKISGKQGKDVLVEMFAAGKSAATVVAERGLVQVSDTGEIDRVIDEVCAALKAGPGLMPELPENPMSADRVRWEHIQRVYELCGRNVSETARRLSMHRRTLQRILAKRAPR